VSLGRPEEFGNDVAEWSPGRRGADHGETYPTPRWTDSLRPFFEGLEEDRFALFQIDYFLHRPARLDVVAVLERLLDREGVVKADLTLDRTFFPHELYAREGELRLIASGQDAPFRSSLQAAIWKRDYLLELLVPGRSPWDFEIIGMCERMDDGKLIVGVADPEHEPVPYVNVYGQGRVNWQHVCSEMNPELLAELLDRGLMGPWWNGWGDGPPERTGPPPREAAGLSARRPA
jgi:hypothetical protein